MRAYWDALPLRRLFSQCLTYFQQDLDYGLSTISLDGFPSPIDLIKGWKSDTVTKGIPSTCFCCRICNPCAVAEENSYGHRLCQKSKKLPSEGNVYGLDGTLIQRKVTSRDVARLPHGLYIVGSRKLLR